MFYLSYAFVLIFLYAFVWAHFYNKSQLFKEQSTLTPLELAILREVTLSQYKQYQHKYPPATYPEDVQ